MIYSHYWKMEPDEEVDAFIKRKRLQMQQWMEAIKMRGQCYMIRFSADDTRPMWEDEIDTSELRDKIQLPIGKVMHCPLCAPYDGTEKRYMTRIIDPKYPEGFADTGGVCTKCSCLLRGAKRERLKFKRAKI